MGAVYTQLSLQERRKIENWWHAKVPVREMARVLKRHKSTIFREIKRNFWADDAFPKKYAGYFGHAAQLQTNTRRSVQRKLIRHPDLCKTVIALIKQGWTPEQIGNRMIYEGAADYASVRRQFIATSTPRKVWIRSCGGTCPSIAKPGSPRRARKRQKPKFDRDVSILFRPDDVAHRRQFGHWEADLVLFKQRFGQSNVTSLVERVSRFTVLLKNPNKRTKPVMGKIMKAVRDLPHIARSFHHLRPRHRVRQLAAPSGRDRDANLVLRSVFSPWQKGTVENTNRRAPKMVAKEARHHGGLRS